MRHTYSRLRSSQIILSVRLTLVASIVDVCSCADHWVRYGSYETYLRLQVL